MNRNLKTGSVVLVAAAAIAIGGTSSAIAARLITGDDIARNTITQRNLANDSVGKPQLKDGVLAGITGPEGPAGTDGTNGTDGKDGKDGKDGVSNLIAGAGYSTTWVGDGGATLQTAREECPAGQYALGGGFSTWGGDKDLGGDNKNIVVTVSAPYFEGEYIPVDEAGNFRPTEWVVKGYNNGDTDQIVRAWVTCATIAD
jgi:hypothetical protein